MKKNPYTFILIFQKFCIHFDIKSWAWELKMMVFKYISNIKVGLVDKNGIEFFKDPWEMSDVLLKQQRRSFWYF